MSEKLSISLAQARRLALTKQRLLHPPKGRASKSAVIDLTRALAYIQWDPVNVVAPTHEILLWSRLGEFRRSDFESLLWREKRLFYGWAHGASLSLTEDYPLHYSIMRRYPESLSSSWGHWRDYARKWIPAHRALRELVLRELGKGPQKASDFELHAKTRQPGSGWTSWSDVSEMLAHLQFRGEVMIVGHEGRENVWGLADAFLPEWADRTELSQPEVEFRSAQRALHALGLASRPEINFYFPKGRYLDLKGTLARLEKESLVRTVRVEGAPPGPPRYILTKDVALAESLVDPVDGPRMTLLSPFDNLITGRRFVHDLFGFDYLFELFVPKERRKYGPYVLPILFGESFVGRIDPKMDREHDRFVVRSVYAEPSAAKRRELGSEIAATIDRFAQFLGANDVEYGARVPAAWKHALR